MNDPSQARWTCAARGGLYLGSHPELSGCVSVWLKRISDKLEGKRSVVLLAKDLVHFLGSHHLFGGDVGALLDVLAAVVDKMHGELVLADEIERVSLNTMFPFPAPRRADRHPDGGAASCRGGGSRAERGAVGQRPPGPGLRVRGLA